MTRSTALEVTALEALIARESARPLPALAAACVASLCRRFGPTTLGVLFYGAGLRQRCDQKTLLDFYVVVDAPRDALKSAMAGAATRVLPPNVYGIDVPYDGMRLRCKVAVIGRAEFERGARGVSCHLWARMSQPVAIAYTRDAAARTFLIATLTSSVEFMIAATIPVMPATFSAAQLWTRALQETYACEVRPERDARAAELVAADKDRYDAVTATALGAADSLGYHARPADADAPAAMRAWTLRRRVGKALNIARLMKAAFTFSGGLDYAVAKIAKHSGITVAISDADRRRPLRAGWRVYLEARRRGGVR